MALGSKKRRKTTSSDILVTYQAPSNLIVINIDMMTMEFGDVSRPDTFYFKQMLHKGCPDMSTSKKGQFRSGQTLELMPREAFIKDTYQTALRWKAEGKSIRTLSGNLSALRTFIRFCDNEALQPEFTTENISAYSKYLNRRVKRAEIIETSAYYEQRNLLRWPKSKNIHGLEDHTYLFNRATDGTTAYTVNEIKLLAKSLHQVVHRYGQHVTNNTTPEYCLFSDLNELKSLQKINSAHSRVNRIGSNSTFWLTTLSAAALQLTAMYTGINNTPLREMKRSDIDYCTGAFQYSGANTYQLNVKEEYLTRISHVSPLDQETEFCESGGFKLNSTKGRQGGQRNSHEFAFSKYAKCFFETWLLINEKIDASPNAFLFPQFVNGQCKQLTPEAMKKFASLIETSTDAPRPQTQRFRTTKTAMIVNTTGSLMLAAEANNHSFESAMRSYTQGDKESKELKLAASMHALRDIAQGRSKNDAINIAQANFKDPMSDFEYQQKSGKIATQTAVGLRCDTPFGDKAQRLSHQLRKEGMLSEGEVTACFKFLDCFRCEHHVVISEINDIWLLLSFQSEVLQLLARPSINSAPSSKLSNASYDVSVILNKIQKVARENYLLAREKFMIAPHPLWSDSSSFESLMGAY
jgi:hypothetical protein